MLAVSHPGAVLEVAQKDLHRVRISFYIILLFSLFYSLTALVLWQYGRTPILEIWIPGIPPDQYYLYQMFWTLPLLVVIWLAVGGFIYLFTCLAGKEAFYEDALMIAALSIAIPYLMFWWVPETFLFPAMGPGNFIKWPELFELERKYVFPGLWQVLLVAFGMRKVNNTNRILGLLAGLCAVVTVFGLFLPFMR
jgi:hypothetical protein